MTDVTFGFDTALGVVTDAIDRLRSTAHRPHRIIVVEVMGHNAGWPTLGAGTAGGAHVIPIPEIPYCTQAMAEAIRQRSCTGSRFSIVAVSEVRCRDDMPSKCTSGGADRLDQEPQEEWREERRERSIRRHGRQARRGHRSAGGRGRQDHAARPPWIQSARDIGACLRD